MPHKRCRHCGVEEDDKHMYVCDRCCAEFYCGTLHQELDWPSHEANCARLSVIARQRINAQLALIGAGKSHRAREELLKPCSLTRSLDRRDFVAIREAFQEAITMGFRKSRNPLGPGLHCSAMGAYYMKTHNVMRELARKAKKFGCTKVSFISTLYEFETSHTHHNESAPMLPSREGDIAINSQEEMDVFWDAFEHCYEEKRAEQSPVEGGEKTLQSDACAIASYANMLLEDPTIKKNL